MELVEIILKSMINKICECISKRGIYIFKQISTTKKIENII